MRNEKTTWSKTLDQFGEVTAPIISSAVPWSGKEPQLQIAQNDGFFGLSSVHPAQYVHAIAVGGTGSGKTVSALLPMLKAHLHYEIECAGVKKKCAMLVLDPKRELLPIIRHELVLQNAADRLIVIDGNTKSPPVKFFSQQGLGLRDKLELLDAVAKTDSLDSGAHAYWHQAGKELLLRVLTLEGDYGEQTCQSLLAKLLKRRSIDPRGFWANVVDFLYRIRFSHSTAKEIQRELRALLCDAHMHEHVDADFLESFLAESDLMQLAYRCQSVEPMVRRLADPLAARFVDFNPFASMSDDGIELRSCMDAGDVVVFQPEPSDSSDMIARALKTLWFQATISRLDMQRPVALIADEFQRVVSLDKWSGDATFLDIARAYRCNVTLATQSIAALEHALGSGPKASAAVSAILANLPTRFFFATKDAATTELVKSLIPPPPVPGPHVVDVRPLTLLKPGEGYFSLADGRSGRGQVDLKNLL